MTTQSHLINKKNYKSSKTSISLTWDSVVLHALKKEAALFSAMIQTAVTNYRKGNEMRLIKTQMESNWKGLLLGLDDMLTGMSSFFFRECLFY